MRLLFDQMSFVALQVLLIFRILGRVLLAFFRENPFLSAGVGLGLLLAVPVGWVPLIGVFLAPIAIPFGLAIGAIAGHRLDRMRRGLEVSDQPAAMFEYLVAAFKKMLSLFGDFYRELRDHFSRSPDQGDRVIEGRARLIVGGQGSTAHAKLLSEISAIHVNNLTELKSALEEIRREVESQQTG